MAHLVLIAGPNGGGKTTLFQHAYPNFDRIDADQISRSLRPHGARTETVEMGRHVLQLLGEALSSERDIVFETTFSGRHPVTLVERARRAGYICTIHFVMLADAELHVRRVADRVRAGGHEVDPNTIRRRYVRSLENLEKNAHRFDRVVLIDNSEAPTVLFVKSNGDIEVRRDTILTHRLRERLS